MALTTLNLRSKGLLIAALSFGVAQSPLQAQ